MAEAAAFLAIWFVVIALFYLLLVRPHKQRERAHQKLVSSLQVGDKVVTVGGIHGTIARVGDDAVTLQVSDNVRIRFSKKAISQKLG